MINRVTIVLLVFLAGCSPLIIGDGMFRVSGDLSSFGNKECEISIKQLSEVEPAGHNARQVSGVFEVDFTVSPSSESYSIEVKCNDRVIETKIITYPKDTGTGGLVKLGVLE